MRIYSIKEQQGRFQPQYKDGRKTLWCWEYFRDIGTTVYSGTGKN